jgi:hypothetical protein
MIRFLISLLLGCADREFALFQHSTKLFVVNIGELTTHLFHQLTLLNFGNADVIQLNPPADRYQRNDFIRLVYISFFESYFIFKQL